MAQQTHTQFRLDQDALDDLIKQLPRPIPATNTTEIQAGFLLGIQHVLDILRTGFTTGSRS